MSQRDAVDAGGAHPDDDLKEQLEGQADVDERHGRRVGAAGGRRAAITGEVRPDVHQPEAGGDRQRPHGAEQHGHAAGGGVPQVGVGEADGRVALQRDRRVAEQRHRADAQREGVEQGAGGAAAAPTAAACREEE